MGDSFRAKYRWAALAVMIFSTGSALGCPVCDTETGRQVREGIFGNDFGLNLLAVMAPVPILVLSAYVVSHWLGKEDKP